MDAVNINAHIKGNNGLLSANIKGYYNNTYNGTFIPQEPITRAEVATMICRIIK